MKHLLSFVLLLTCLALLVSCQPSGPEPADSGTADPGQSATPTQSGTGSTGLPEEPEPAEDDPVTYALTGDTAGVRILGVRNLASTEQINLDWSCSGFELTVENKGGDVRFQVTTSDNQSAYFRIWLDGETWEQSNGEIYYRVGGKGTIIMRDVPAGRHTVRVLKVTGYTLARSAVLSVTLNGSILPEAPAERELYVEFVGDSITCGWGTIGAHGGAYSDQDGTLAYSYLLAGALDADYSMTALSGQGLLWGDPGLTEGYLYASPMRDDQTPYDFARQADLVVINIGTNDFSKGVSEEEFRAAYRDFLQTVREKNGEDCRILCLYNAMNDTFSAAIESVVAGLGGMQNGIWSYRLPRAEGNRHPSAEEHAAYAEQLLPLVQQLLAYEGGALELVESGDGDLDAFDFAAAKRE